MVQTTTTLDHHHPLYNPIPLFHPTSTTRSDDTSTTRTRGPTSPRDEDSFRIGGKSLSSLFPAAEKVFGAVAESAGININPFAIAHAVSDALPAGRDLGGIADQRSPMRKKWDHYADIVRAHGGQVNPDG